MTRAQALGSCIAVLLLLGAGLGSRGGGSESCSCRPERGPDASMDGASSRGAATSPETTTLEHPAAPGTPETAAAAAPGAIAATLRDFEDATWTRVASVGGKYLICWRSLAGKVPRNEDFELEVWVLRDGAPIGEAILEVGGWMPDHGHGMLRKTRTVRNEDGSFRVEGMLLHMRGTWQLRFDVLEGTLAESAESVIEL